MTLLSVAARRATPMVSRAGRQQMRWNHYDAFGIDPNSKKQVYTYNAAMLGALMTPVFAVRYQLNKWKYDKRHF